MFQRTARRVSILMLAAMVSLAALASDAGACPKCRESLPNGSEKNGKGEAEPNVAQGYAWSIYLMIGVPFLMVATLGGAAIVVLRKADANMPPISKK